MFFLEKITCVSISLSLNSIFLPYLIVMDNSTIGFLNVFFLHFTNWKAKFLKKDV